MPWLVYYWILKLPLSVVVCRCGGGGGGTSDEYARFSHDLKISSYIGKDNVQIGKQL